MVNVLRFHRLLFALYDLFPLNEGLAGVNALTSRAFEIWLIDKPVY